MTVGERIKACRLQAGLSQEKVAEAVGVSRQAVSKWEADLSAPGTDNLFQLAELFGTTVDLLLAAEEKKAPSAVEQVYELIKSEEENKRAARSKRMKKNIRSALLMAGGYLLIYLIGRILWCDRSESSFLGWLLTARPSGEHSYLFGWLLHQKCYWLAMAVSVLPSLWGKVRFSHITLAGFVVGLSAGIVFGPYPEGAATGQTHFGWAIWGAVFLLSVAVGVFIEHLSEKRSCSRAES